MSKRFNPSLKGKPPGGNKPGRKRKPGARPLPTSAARDARRLLAPIEREMIGLLQKLVRTDSVAVPPNGNEAAAQGVLHRFCRAAGLDVEMYDTAFLSLRRHSLVRRDRNYANRPNLIARIPGTGRGSSLLFTGHIDTVPPGPAAWKDGPFSGVLRGGKLYGRGSFDMKGGLAAHFAAAAALARAGVRLGGDLLFESVVDEEWAGGGGTLAGRLRGDNADACVITEGTQLAVLRATRGGHFLDITASAGDPSAYFSADQVVSPALPIGRLLGWIDGWATKRRKIDRGLAYADFDDPAPVQVLALEANRFDADVPWSVPTEARVRVYFQFLPHEDVPAVMAAIKRSFERFVAADPFFRAHPPRWRDISDPPLLGHELPADHEWTRHLARCAAAVLGSRPTISAAPTRATRSSLTGRSAYRRCCLDRVAAGRTTSTNTSRPVRCARRPRCCWRRRWNGAPDSRPNARPSPSTSALRTDLSRRSWWHGSRLPPAEHDPPKNAGPFSSRVA